MHRDHAKYRSNDNVRSLDDYRRRRVRDRGVRVVRQGDRLRYDVTHTMPGVRVTASFDDPVRAAMYRYHAGRIDPAA
jgi:hypothetical protein